MSDIIDHLPRSFREELEAVLALLRASEPAYGIKQTVLEALSSGLFAATLSIEDLQEALERARTPEEREDFAEVLNAALRIEELQAEIARLEDLGRPSEEIPELADLHSELETLLASDPRLRQIFTPAVSERRITTAIEKLQDALAPARWAERSNGEVDPLAARTPDQAQRINDLELEAADALLAAARVARQGDDVGGAATADRLGGLARWLLHADRLLAWEAIRRADEAWHANRPEDEGPGRDGDARPPKDANASRLRELWMEFVRAQRVAEESEEPDKIRKILGAMSRFCPLITRGMNTEARIVGLDDGDDRSGGQGPPRRDPPAVIPRPEEDIPKFVWNHTFVNDLTQVPGLTPEQIAEHTRCQELVDRCWREMVDCAGRLPQAEKLHETNLLRRVILGDPPPPRRNRIDLVPSWYPGYQRAHGKIYFDPFTPHAVTASRKHMRTDPEQADDDISPNDNPYQNKDVQEPRGLSTNRANWLIVLGKQEVKNKYKQRHSFIGASNVRESHARVLVRPPEDLAPGTLEEVEKLAIQVSIIHELAHQARPSYRQSHDNAAFYDRFDVLWISWIAWTRVPEDSEQPVEDWKAEVNRLVQQMKEIRRLFQGGRREDIERAKALVADPAGPFGPYFETQTQ